MREITLETKIADLLNNYDDMKSILIEINPKFKKLNNPVLRRTIGRVAGVKQAAIVGGMDPLELLNRLRVAVGQEPVLADANESDLLDTEDRPEWIFTEPKAAIDANEILDSDGNPLAVSNKSLSSLSSGEVLVITADFRPEPLVDHFLENGHTVYVDEVDENRFDTYVKKS